MQEYGTWKVTLPDQNYMWEPDEMMGSECYAVELEVGMEFEAWITAIDSRSWIACQTLVWFLRNKAGLYGERRDLDFKLRQLKLVRMPDPKAVTEPSETDGSSPSPDSESAPATSTR